MTNSNPSTCVISLVFATLLVERCRLSRTDRRSANMAVRRPTRGASTSRSFRRARSSMSTCAIIRTRRSAWKVRGAVTCGRREARTHHVTQPAATSSRARLLSTFPPSRKAPCRSRPRPEHRAGEVQLNLDSSKETIMQAKLKRMTAAAIIALSSSALVQSQQEDQEHHPGGAPTQAQPAQPSQPAPNQPSAQASPPTAGQPPSQASPPNAGQPSAGMPMAR